MTLRLHVPALAGLDLAATVGATAPGGPAWALCAPRDIRASHGVEITLGRLREMAEAYDPIGREAAAINFDHLHEGDAHGWLEHVWVDGTILWGRPRDLSDDARQKIQSGARRRVSCEIACQHEVTGGWYLTGLALLGSTRPAILGLPAVTLAADPARRAYVWLAADRRLALASPTLTAPTPGADIPTPTPTADDPAGQETIMDDETTATAGAASAASEPGNPPAPAPAAATTTAPQSIDLAAQQRRVDDLLAQAERTNRDLRLRSAALDVDGELTGRLRGRLTPAQLRATVNGVTLRDALVQLRAAETPATIQLAATATRAAAEASVYEVVLAALAAAPAFTALGAGQLATADAPTAATLDDRTAEQRAVDLSLGITDEVALATRRRHAASILLDTTN